MYVIRIIIWLDLSNLDQGEVRGQSFQKVNGSRVPSQGQPIFERRETLELNKLL